MPKEKSRPTDAELDILQILWDAGPQTVRQVHEAVARRRKAGYTSVLKMMQVMHEKRLVACDKSKMTHVYRARVTKDATIRRMVIRFLDRVFGGSADKLVLELLAAKKTSRKELEEICRLMREGGEGE